MGKIIVKKQHTFLKKRNDYRLKLKAHAGQFDQALNILHQIANNPVTPDKEKIAAASKIAEIYMAMAKADNEDSIRRLTQEMEYRDELTKDLRLVPESLPSPDNQDVAPTDETTQVEYQEEEREDEEIEEEEDDGIIDVDFSIIQEVQIGNIQND